MVCGVCGTTAMRRFEGWFAAQGLLEKTVDKHLSNIEFYLSTYLLREAAHPMPDSCRPATVDDFFGHFFPRKCMWSIPATIRENIASLKKFYKCMVVRGLVDEADYQGLLSIIKENKDERVDFCARYNDPDADFDDLRS